MLIVCPTCASEYRIDATRVGMEGRSVRCAACRETWFLTPADLLAAQVADLDAAAAEPADAPSDADWEAASAAVRAAAGEVVDNVPPEPEAPLRKSAPRPGAARPASRLRLAGFSPALAAGLVVLAALPLAGLARQSVVRAVPQTAGLYARIGLPVNLRGLDIRDVVAFRSAAEPDRPAELVVEGDLVGLGAGTTPVPALAIEVRDAAGRPLRTLPVPAPRPALAEGESARFRATFPDPPAQGRALQVAFAEVSKDASKDATKAAEKAAGR